MNAKVDPLAPGARTCMSCRWFVDATFTCHRYPPQTVLVPSDNQPPVMYWPGPAWAQVTPTDFCGEWSKEP